MREYSRRAGPTTRGPMPLKKDNRLLIYDLDSLASRLLPFFAFPLRVLRRHLVLRSFSVFLVPSVSLPLRNNRLAPRARGIFEIPGHEGVVEISCTRSRSGRGRLSSAHSTPTVEFFTGFPGRNINFEVPVICHVTYTRREFYCLPWAASLGESPSEID